jgi:HK97 family phage portal protein
LLLKGELMANIFSRFFNTSKEVISESRSIGWDDFDNLTSPSKSGVSITKDNAMAISGVYAAVKLLTDSISSLPVHLIKETKDKKEKDYTNPVYKIVSKEPNSLMTSYTWRQIVMPQLLLWGNSYNVIDWDKKTMRPRQLMPVHASKVKVEVRKGIAYYTIQLESKTITVDQSNMVHFRGLGDEIEGKSVIDYAKDNLGLGKAAEEFGSKFFSNGASIGGVYEHPTQLSDKAYNNLQKSLERRTSGLNNSHKILILEEGMKFTTTSIPPNAAQFLETRKFSINDISRWFGVPPHMIGDLERATFSNIEQQNLNFSQFSILPYVILMEQELNRKLLQEAEKDSMYFKLNMDGLLRGDMATRYAAYQTGIQNGIINPNDVRKKEDLDAYDGGNDYWMAANITRIKDLNKTEDGK